MPYTYPGVYVTELPSAVHSITGVATSITAFVGWTARGIDNRAQAIFSFADYERLYGGLDTNSEVSYAVAQFYQNAPGAQAYVVRVPKIGAKPASVTFDEMTFSALSSGTWADGNLLINVDAGPPADLVADPQAFNLTVTNMLDGTTESFPNITLDQSKMNYVATVINDADNGSQLVTVTVSGTTAPTAPVPVTGFLGSPITISGLEGQIGTKAAPSVVNGDWGFQLDTTDPGTGSVQGLPAPVTVFADKSPIPQSLSGLAFHVQQAINAALAARLPGATVACSVAPVLAADNSGTWGWWGRPSGSSRPCPTCPTPCSLSQRRPGADRRTCGSTSASRPPLESLRPPLRYPTWRTTRWARPTPGNRRPARRRGPTAPACRRRAT
jgi:hypothetical protein